MGNRISYGCDTKVGVCWSECIGSLKNEMYAGKSGKHGKADKHHRGRRARPSPEKLAELVSEAEVDYDNYDGYNITTDPNFIMGRPITDFQQCSTNEDCANMARHCAIGCSNMEE